jgi:hypothetical protein
MDAVGKKEKKARIKLDFHDIGNMKNCKSKLQENATFSGSMERIQCKCKS